MFQMILRLLFVLGDVCGNIYMLTNHQPFLIGADYGQSIVFFNAAMILIIYVVDYIIVKTQKLRIDLAVGEGLTDLHRHEQ
jgi:hypothetical protein